MDTDLSTAVPHLDRACELLWHAGHPRIAEALEKEVRQLVDSRAALERVVYPKPLKAVK